MRTTAFLTLFFTVTLAFSQTVTTISVGTPDDDMVFDSQGNLYASSYSAGKIFKYDASWNVTEFTTFPVNAVGLAINSSDEIYNCDFGTSSIHVFSPNGALSDDIAQTGFPAGIIKDFDSDDMIFTKYSGNSIHRLKPDGTISLISNATGLNTPVGLTFDDNGVLYAANYETREIHRILSDGSLEYIATVGNESVLGYIRFAQGVLWGTVLGEHKIYIINPDAVDEVTVFAGSVGGTTDGDISVATFAAPNGILFNESEDIMYITEFNTKNIRVISDISLSIPDFKSNSVVIYTPQDKNEVLIKGKIDAANNLDITIRDITGQMVFNDVSIVKGTTLEKTITTDSWQDGVYLMTIKADNYITIKKFVVVNY